MRSRAQENLRLASAINIGDTLQRCCFASTIFLAFPILHIERELPWQVRRSRVHATGFQIKNEAQANDIVR